MAIEVNLRKDTNQVVQSEKNVASLVGFLRKMVSWFEGKLRAFSERTCLPITENKLRWLFFTILYGHCLWFVSVVLIFPTNIIHGFARAFPPSLSVSLFQLLYGDTAIWNTFLWGLLIFYFFWRFLTQRHISDWEKIPCMTSGRGRGGIRTVYIHIYVPG